ncbi:energy-coupling factor transport system ATP-binding protein [Caldalkalibacillus uzonensis]|uniref:Energy-coupling factor transport system ATP-binding protein n=1 Tax=Caldalkalibacillus uzonensis TaxID=353224 RepID=A0ABU0CWE1_9BACI|nr:energy-coupling factor transporter ATPase [Caldalkalibacillus uzonensis]MDQ0340216.1 energy-coupling factor transport system ATP-binding protein [Caldalkalibacillus uzonensis]
MIQFENVSFSYTDMAEPLIKKISFSIKQGEWVAIIGPNGSGKSTIGKLINGLLIPDSGTIRVKGLDPAIDQERWQVRRTVGMVFQNPENQLVGTTVMDDVAFGLENLGVSPEDMLPIIQHSLKKVNLWEYREQEPHHLSGGQKQRLAIASVLAMKPEVLLFDEATSMLDPVGRQEVVAMMHLLHREGLTVINITHDMDEAQQAERVMLIAGGKIAADGPAREILSQADLLRTHRLDPPFAVEVREALKSQGLSLADTIHTKKELVEALWKLSQST